jgi:hypothetical protein
MRQIGMFLAAVLALVSAGCASTPPSAAPSVDVTGKSQGTWQFEQVALGGGQVIMDLKQSGAEVTGDVVVTGPSVNRPSTMQATVSGNRLTLKGRVPGTLSVTGNTMTGVVYGVVEANVTLQRQ